MAAQSFRWNLGHGSSHQIFLRIPLDVRITAGAAFQFGNNLVMMLDSCDSSLPETQ